MSNLLNHLLPILLIQLPKVLDTAVTCSIVRHQVGSGLIGEAHLIVVPLRGLSLSPNHGQQWLQSVKSTSPIHDGFHTIAINGLDCMCVVFQSMVLQPIDRSTLESRLVNSNRRVFNLESTDAVVVCAFSLNS
mmetsp:Transcript_4960/g.13893  ORF Transcript_4960/g.13893 Transcript_4960/m.13893 type:complete len:133 (-) Transcript_4960:65-463(-)